MDIGGNFNQLYFRLCYFEGTRIHSSLFLPECRRGKLVSKCDKKCKRTKSLGTEFGHKLTDVRTVVFTSGMHLCVMFLSCISEHSTAVISRRAILLMVDLYFFKLDLTVVDLLINCLLMMFCV